MGLLNPLIFTFGFVNVVQNHHLHKSKVSYGDDDDRWPTGAAEYKEKMQYVISLLNVAMAI